jgi:hypothetical protein
MSDDVKIPDVLKDPVVEEMMNGVSTVLRGGRLGGGLVAIRTVVDPALNSLFETLSKEGEKPDEER